MNQTFKICDMDDSGIIIPASAEESLYVESLARKDMGKFLEWAQTCYDHIVARYNSDLGTMTVWCWVMPEPVMELNNINPWGHWTYGRVEEDTTPWTF